MMQNYFQLVEKIAKASGLSVEEVDRRVEAKCAKLSGLISKEGSAQIVASELGVSFEKEKLKIAEIMRGMKKVNTTAKVVKINSVNSFTTKKGLPGKVLSVILADETGNIRCVLWDTNHIELFEKGKIKDGDVIEVFGASVRNDEIHLGSFSDIKISKEIIENVNVEKKFLEKKLFEIKTSDIVKLRGIVVQIYEPRFFESCPDCNKKVIDSNCEKHGKVIPNKKAVLSIVIDDGTETLRGVLFGEEIKKLGFDESDFETADLFLKKKEIILGEEMIFSGIVRSNKVFNTNELVIENVEKIDIESLIESLRRE